MIMTQLQCILFFYMAHHPPYFKKWDTAAGVFKIKYVKQIEVKRHSKN